MPSERSYLTIPMLSDVRANASLLQTKHVIFQIIFRPRSETTRSIFVFGDHLAWLPSA